MRQAIALSLEGTEENDKEEENEEDEDKDEEDLLKRAIAMSLAD